MNYPPRQIDYSLLPSDIIDGFDFLDDSGTFFASFWGTNSLILQNKTNSLMIDPYFSRIKFDPINPLNSNKSYIQPDKSKVFACLDKLDINIPQAIAFTHAHFDHALDLPLISTYYFDKTGSYPRILGCSSIANILIGGIAEKSELDKLSKSRGKNHNSIFSDICKKYNIFIVNHNELVKIGPFEITFLEGHHTFVPLARFWLNGTIDKPLRGPVKVYDYKSGKMHKILIKTDVGKILLIGSAGFKDNEFTELVNIHGKPDYLFTAIAGLSRNREIQRFVENVINPLSPKSIYYTHWDDFDQPLDEPVDYASLTNPESVLKKVGKKSRLFPIMKKIPLFPNGSFPA